MRFNLCLTTALTMMAWGENSPAQAIDIDSSDKKISSKQSAFSSPNESISAAERVSHNALTSITIFTGYDKQLSDLEELLENPSLKKVKVLQKSDYNLGWVTLGNIIIKAEESLGHLLSEKVKANPNLKVSVKFKEVQHIGPRNGSAEDNFNYFKTVVDAYPSMSKFIWHFNIELWSSIYETEGYYGDYPFPQKVMEYCLGKFLN